MIEVKTGAFKVSENLFGKTALPSLAACYACLTAKLDTHFSLSRPPWGGGVRVRE